MVSVDSSFPRLKLAVITNNSNLHAQDWIIMNEFTNQELNQYFNEHPGLIDKVAAKIKMRLDSEAEAFLKDEYRQATTFQQNLLKTWKAPMVRLDAMIACTSEILAEKVNQSDTNQQQFNIANKLYARAIHIAKEISHLLKGGFADGAMARWRSLHETTVITSLLATNDEMLTLRFIDYQAVERLKAAKTYIEHQEFLDFERISPLQLSEYEAEVACLCQKYGNNFKKEYGWASEKFPQHKRITFKDIEESVNLRFLRIHYNFSSKNVHSGIDSIGYQLGISMSNANVLLAGPSNEGLVDPLQCTSLSLCYMTNAIITLNPDISSHIDAITLWKMHESMKIEAVQAAKQLMKQASKAGKKIE